MGDALQIFESVVELDEVNFQDWVLHVISSTP
jgi:hypothetical protein